MLLCILETPVHARVTHIRLSDDVAVKSMYVLTDGPFFSHEYWGGGGIHGGTYTIKGQEASTDNFGPMSCIGKQSSTDSA